jgi:hypothetical protein
MHQDSSPPGGPQRPRTPAVAAAGSCRRGSPFAGGMERAAVRVGLHDPASVVWAAMTLFLRKARSSCLIAAAAASCPSSASSVQTDRQIKRPTPTWPSAAAQTSLRGRALQRPPPPPPPPPPRKTPGSALWTRAAPAQGPARRTTPRSPRAGRAWRTPAPRWRPPGRRAAPLGGRSSGGSCLRCRYIEIVIMVVQKADNQKRERGSLTWFSRP